MITIFGWFQYCHLNFFSFADPLVCQLGDLFLYYLFGGLIYYTYL